MRKSLAKSAQSKARVLSAYVREYDSLLAASNHIPYRKIHNVLCGIDARISEIVLILIALDKARRGEED